MEFIRGLHNIREKHKHCALTIGNFDGLHLGHQAIFRRLAQKAQELSTCSCLMTFEPLPHEYFNTGMVPARLTRLSDKLLIMQSLPKKPGIDYLLCLRFGPRFAALSANEFVDKILVEALSVKLVLVGDDFRYGHNRTGDVQHLREAATQHAFDVEDTPTQNVNSTRVSSTRIRNALAIGDFDTTEKLLGRPYSITGRVAHGDKRGRTIGFPTANIHLHRKVCPLRGVYAVRLTGNAIGTSSGVAINGVANVGTRPTVNGDRYQLEVFLFNFDSDIYGKRVNVEFHHKIRDEEKFPSLEELRRRIYIDSQQARKYFRDYFSLNS